MEKNEKMKKSAYSGYLISDTIDQITKQKRQREQRDYAETFLSIIPNGTIPVLDPNQTSPTSDLPGRRLAESTPP